eukprot:gene10876-12534_t
MLRREPGFGPHLPQGAPGLAAGDSARGFVDACLRGYD